MKLVLQLPEGWIERPKNARLSEITIHHQADVPPDLLLWVRRDLPMPIGFKSWIEEAMRHEQPAGTRYRPIAMERRQSTLGWPVSIARAEILGEGDQVIEERIGVFYRLLDYAAELVLRSRDHARLLSLWAEIQAVLLSGDADWTQEQAPSLYHLRSEGMKLSDLTGRLRTPDAP